jgi:hypothetical protein
VLDDDVAEIDVAGDERLRHRDSRWVIEVR